MRHSFVTNWNQFHQLFNTAGVFSRTHFALTISQVTCKRQMQKHFRHLVDVPPKGFLLLVEFTNSDLVPSSVRKVRSVLFVAYCLERHKKNEGQFFCHVRAKVPKIQIRSDGVKDDSVSYVVFAEGSSSPSRMTAAKFWTLLWDLSKWVLEDKHATQYIYFFFRSSILHAWTKSWRQGLLRRDS